MLQTLKKNRFLIVTLLPAFSYIAFFFVIIAFFLIKLSLTTYQGGLVQENMVLSNYVELIQSDEFRTIFLRTIIFVLIVTPLELITGLIIAMIVEKKFFGRGIVRSIFLLPLAIPTIVTTSILLLMFSQGGHITSLLVGDYAWFPSVVDSDISFMSNEVLALSVAIFGKVWRDTPITMLILLAGLQSITKDQYEAGRTMGSSTIQNFKYITVPLLIPAISSVLVLRSIEAWKEFIFPYILAPSFPILGVLIEKYYVQLLNPGMSAAIGIILVICILLSSLLLGFITKKVNSFLVKV